MQDDSLWEYSLAVYGRRGVEPLLLQLQDDYGMDINLLLAACWLAGAGRELAEPKLSEALRESEPWNAGCIGPLRSARRFLKGVPGREAFRERLKALELEAEQLQQQTLCTILRDSPVTSDKEGFGSLALKNIRGYAARRRGGKWLEMATVVEALVALLDEGGH